MRNNLNLFNRLNKITEKKFQELLKKLNIQIVTLTIKQKDDIKKEDKNKCD